jgi:hypothetical protein
LRGGAGQAEGAGPVEGLEAAVGAELVVPVPHVSPDRVHRYVKLAATPSTDPYRRISPGHSRPISNDSTVPVTAPTAISTAMACDQRRASRIAVWLPRRSPVNSASSTNDGSAIPKQVKMMWNPSVVARGQL